MQRYSWSFKWLFETFVNLRHTSKYPDEFDLALSGGKHQIEELDPKVVQEITDELSKMSTTQRRELMEELLAWSEAGVIAIDDLDLAERFLMKSVAQLLFDN